MYKPATVVGITKTFILCSLAAIGSYDVFAFMQGGVDATISRVMLGASYEHPAIPFSVGFIMGHLFWPQPLKAKDVNVAKDVSVVKDENKV